MTPVESTSHTDADPCVHCGSPSTILCDYLLGLEEGGEQFIQGTPRHPEQGWYSIVTADSHHFTCDRPLCDDCAVSRGAFHFDGNRDTVEGWGEPFRSTVSIDYCREHATGPNDPARMDIITEAQAEMLRKVVWVWPLGDRPKKYRREPRPTMADVPGYSQGGPA